MLHFDFSSQLSEGFLMKADKNTMANSIEGRVPFLDHTLVEYGTSLHPSLKLHKGTTKAVLRCAMQKLLPATSQKTKKHAFFMPLDSWYKEELKDLAEQLFTKQSVRQRGFFKYDALTKIWDNYNQSKLLYGKQLFTMINFELWNRMFIDEEPAKGIELKSLV